MTSNRSLPARLRRSAVLFTAAVLTAGVSGVASPAVAAPPEKTAVIVQLTPGADAAAESRRAAANGGGSVRHVYTNVFEGFAGEFTPGAINGMRNNPRVASIEADGIATTVGTQGDATWGIDRIDQRALPLSRSYTYTGSGAGVTAYVIDSGISPDAEEFGSRLGAGFTSISDTYGTDDCNGHGTHVAGTIGGTTYGVAKGVTLVPVRVLDCGGSGTWSGVVAGIDWVAGQHDNGERSVANMSLGGSRNSSVDAAVARLVKDGVTVAVAAGNNGRDACNYSPARVPEAITVGATNDTDTRASWSNFGKCLDLFAPGVGITSAWPADVAPGSTTNTISGTSMASPHVAGAAAVLLGGGYLDPTTLTSTLVNAATPKVVKSPGRNSPNRLLFSSSTP